MCWTIAKSPIGSLITWTSLTNLGLGFLAPFLETCILYAMLVIENSSQFQTYRLIAPKSGIILITWASPVHPRLAVLGLLRCTQDDFASHFGIKCSSYSKMNVGTSRRSACDALGWSEYLSVQIGNVLLERTVSGTTMIHNLFKLFIFYITNQGIFKSR